MSPVKTFHSQLSVFNFHKKNIPLQRNLRGALIIQAEIIPVKPDPDNAGVGNGCNIYCTLFTITW